MKPGYEHYEISNFCKPGMYSRHNTSYWQGVSYLGCGPSAHSFDGQTREWNCSSIEKYMSGIESGQRDFEREERIWPPDTTNLSLPLSALNGEFHSNASVMITERNWSNIVSKWHVLL